MKPIIRKLLVSSLLFSAPLAVLAGGFQSNNVSPRLQGQAMAGGGADVGDVTAIFINPAILSTIHKPEIYLGGSYDAPRIGMNNAVAEHGIIAPTTQAPILFPVAGTTTQKNIAVAKTLPNFYAALPVNHDLAFGLSFVSPWNYETKYDATSAVGYMAQRTDLTAYNLSGLVSYAVDDTLSLAAGIQGQYLAADISNFDDIPVGTIPASDMQADNIGLGYLLGFLYSPDTTTHVGVSYRSKIDYRLNGHGTQYTTNSGTATYAECTSGNIASRNCYTSTDMHTSTPGVLNMSLVQQLTSQWQLDFTTQVTFWSQFKGIAINMPDAYIDQTSIEQHWQNAALYALGTNYQLNPHWIFRGGVGYDQTPTVANSRDARIPDNNKVLAALGLTYQLNQHFRVDASYEHAFMESQTLNAYQTYSERRGYIDPAGSASIYPVNPYQANLVTADYSGSSDIFALGVNYIF